MAIMALMTGGTVLNLFQQTVSERFFDLAIAKGHAVGCAVGLVNAGSLLV
jgi:deoxyxylulose-5-phosphate synthase